jgi:ABC-type nitrate/sulfonate/bicarbonate transport system ATPase subunit
MLKIENFTLSFENERFMLIDDILFAGGKKINLFADNSSGKTLLLRSIHGDFTKFEGSILIKEKPPLFYKKRKKTILVENQVHLLMNESIWKNITLPLENISSRQKQKITDLCSLAGLSEKIGTKVNKLPFSSQKFVELIRAVIQLPYLILIDDMDNFFDGKNLLKALEISEYALNSGSSLLATSKNKMEHFDITCRVQDKRVVIL